MNPEYMTYFMTYILPAGVLISAVVDDLRSRKIHNKLIIVLAVICFLSALLIQGLQGLILGFVLLLFSLLITVPLVLLKVIGGGDMKLFAVLALILPPRILVLTFVFSFLWGALLGVLKTLLDKKTSLLYFNMWFLFKFKPPSSEQLHTFPFSVSLLLGWMSALWF